MTLSYSFPRLPPAFTPRGVSLCFQPSHGSAFESCSSDDSDILVLFARLPHSFLPRDVSLCPLSFCTAQPLEAEP